MTPGTATTCQAHAIIAAATAPWMPDLSDDAGRLVVLGANLLLQSSVLLGAGLLLAHWARRHSAATSAAVLRATLAAVMLCPLASWVLREAGVAATIVRLPRGERMMPAAPESHNGDLAFAESGGVSAGGPYAVPPPLDERPSDSTGFADASSLDMFEADPRQEHDAPGVDTAGTDSIHRPDAGAPPLADTRLDPGATGDSPAASHIGASPAPSADSDAAPPARLHVLYVVLAGLWLAGSALLLVRLFIAWLGLHRVRRAAGAGAGVRETGRTARRVHAADPAERSHRVADAHGHHATGHPPAVP